MRAPQIRPDDLPENPPHGVCLYCPVCHGEYSATRGDYFMAPNHVLKCGGKGHGGPTANLRLVRKVTRLEEM